MLFNILKLFGLDVRAEIAGVKGQIEQRIDDIADHAKHVALSTAVILALSTFAGLFCTMAIGVGLVMLIVPRRRPMVWTPRLPSLAPLSLAPQ
jgi:hypothetical protein